MTSVIIIEFVRIARLRWQTLECLFQKTLTMTLYWKHHKTTENRFLEGGDYQNFRLRRATIIMSTPTTDKFWIQLKNIVFSESSGVLKLRIPPFIRIPPLFVPDLEQGGVFLKKCHSFLDFALFFFWKPLQKHCFCKENHALAAPNSQNFRLRRAAN